MPESELKTILRQGAKHQGVQVCPGGERQEVEPEDLELRRGSDGAGTEKEILEPGKRVYPWSLITSKGRAEAVSLGTAVGCVVTWLKVTGSCQPLLGGAFSLDVPIFTPAGFLGLRNSRESPVLDTFCAHSFSYAEALQLQI